MVSFSYRKLPYNYLSARGISVIISLTLVFVIRMFYKRQLKQIRLLYLYIPYVPFFFFLEGGGKKIYIYIYIYIYSEKVSLLFAHKSRTVSKVYQYENKNSLLDGQIYIKAALLNTMAFI